MRGLAKCFTFGSQVQKRNDLFVCECYLILLAEMAGLIGRERHVSNAAA